METDREETFVGMETDREETFVGMETERRLSIKSQNFEEEPWPSCTA